MHSNRKQIKELMNLEKSGCTSLDEIADPFRKLWKKSLLMILYVKTKKREICADGL